MFKNKMQAGVFSVILLAAMGCGSSQMTRNNYPVNYHDGNADFNFMINPDTSYLMISGDSAQHIAAFFWKDDKNKYSEMNYRFPDADNNLRYIVRYCNCFTGDSTTSDTTKFYYSDLKKDINGNLYLFTDVEYNKTHPDSTDF